MEKREKQQRKKISETKSWFFEKIDQIDKLLASLTDKGKDAHYQTQK